jgi:hypothetical protein
MRGTRTPQNRRKTGKKNPVPRSESTQWKPGQSGNPGGRPRTAPLSQACRELLNAPVPNDPQARTYAQVIAAQLAKKAMRGDVEASRELANRAEGKARQAVDIESTISTVDYASDFADWSRGELAAFAERGIIPGRFKPHEQEN